MYEVLVENKAQLSKQQAKLNQHLKQDMEKLLKDTKTSIFNRFEMFDLQLQE